MYNIFGTEHSRPWKCILIVELENQGLGGVHYLWGRRLRASFSLSVVVLAVRVFSNYTSCCVLALRHLFKLYVMFCSRCATVFNWRSLFVLLVRH